MTYTIYADINFTKKIIYKNIGLTFRKLYLNEKKKIKKDISILLKFKDRILNFKEKYGNEYNNFDLILAAKKQEVVLNEKIDFDIFVFGCQLITGGFSYNTQSQIDSILNKIIVIDFDGEVLKEYISDDYHSKFISNFLCLSNYYDNPINFGEFERKDYSYILEKNLLNFSDSGHYLEIMINLLFTYDGDVNSTNSGYILKKVNLSKKYLIQMERFLKSLDDEQLLKFIEIIDLLFEQKVVVQTLILNNVLVVESLIIRENADIQKEYVLKGGMILRNYLKSRSIASNDAVKLLLEFVYNLRSDIIHGNLKKIENDLNRINQKDPSIKELIGEIKDFKTKKLKAYGLAYHISFLVVRCVMKYWIDNPFDVFYLKNN